jgi:hypothetical protein
MEKNFKPTERNRLFIGNPLIRETFRPEGGLLDNIREQ